MSYIIKYISAILYERCFSRLPNIILNRKAQRCIEKYDQKNRPTLIPFVLNFFYNVYSFEKKF